MAASSVVIMKMEDNILSKEIGSYEIEGDIGYVFKVYVEDDIVRLYLTSNRDLTDDEFTKVFELYDTKGFEEMGLLVEEIDDEYNPVWLVKFKLNDDYDKMVEMLNKIIGIHQDEMERIYVNL